MPIIVFPPPAPPPYEAPAPTHQYTDAVVVPSDDAAPVYVLKD